MSTTKRTDVKEQRLRRQREQRMRTFLTIGGILLLLVLVFSLPAIVDAFKPITMITPREMPLADGKAVGDPNAPVVVEVFSDFQCSACKRFAAEAEPLLLESDYVANGQVYFIFRHFPFLDDNALVKESDQAANASMCALEQGQFWNYHDMIYANWAGENTGAFSDKFLLSLADALELNMTDFKACFEENRYAGQINQDVELGGQMNVTGTPAVFVNGQAVAPGFVPTYENIDAAIQEALANGGQ